MGKKRIGIVAAILTALLLISAPIIISNGEEPPFVKAQPTTSYVVS